MPAPNAAYVDALRRATEKLAQIPSRPHEPLSPDQVAQLSDALCRDLMRFGDRARTANISDAGGPYFERARILRIASPAPFPAQTAFAAWLASGPIVLSSHPSALEAVNTEELSARTSDPDLAVALAGTAGMWVGASLMLEVRLNAIDDIPFRRATDEDRASESELRRKFTSHIVPPAVDHLPDGVRMTIWLLSESRLRRRVSEVRRGAISVTEDVLADVPAFPGRMWAMREGRFVPIG